MNLSEAVGKYIDSQRKSGISANTVRSRAADLRQFLLVCGDRSLAGVTQDAVQGVFDDMIREKGHASSTVFKRRSTAHSFFVFCRQNGYLESDPLAGVRLPVKAPALLTQNEVRRLLHAPVREQKKLRKELQRREVQGSDTRTVWRKLQHVLQDRAVLELLFATGMRARELAGLAVGDFNFHNNTVVIGKSGGKRRLGYFPSGDVAEALAAHAALRRKAASDETASFFAGARGGLLSPEAVRATVRHYAAAAHIKKAATPFMLRRTLAALLLEQGTDIRAVEHILGTSSRRILKLYARP